MRAGLRILFGFLLGCALPAASPGAAEPGALAQVLGLREASLLVEEAGVAVIARQAALIADWMGLGFIHGVMNTDNMAISGETIDYGPCAFMESYAPGTVFSSIDHQGRYAYQNQPLILGWNLARLAETLVLLLDPVPEKAIAIANDRLAGIADHVVRLGDPA